MRIAALALLVLAGCQSARMALPEELASTERWTVEGRQGFKIRERLRFGPYEVADVNRSWTRGSGQRATAYEQDEREQHFSFVLRESGQNLWHVKCQTILNAASIKTRVVDIVLSDRSRLNCAHTNDNGTTWLLALEDEGDRPFEGEFSSNEAKIAVHGTRKLQTSIPAPTVSGYYIEDGENSLGAVEVINKGAVVVSADLSAERRALVSSAAAALLLVEDLRSHLDQ